ncbi:hypothetical protein CPB86DRAFT_771556 [Serendipita vermifera]|nr:hypothetical protein CPB86DRAFT_771556 [Serendipita vermifera]
MKGYNTPPKESGPYERLTFIQEDPTLPNQRKKPRTLTACDRCRARKVKCEQGPNSDKCDACLLARQECEFKARDQRFHTSTSTTTPGSTSTGSYQGQSVSSQSEQPKGESPSPPINKPSSHPGSFVGGSTSPGKQPGSQAVSTPPHPPQGSLGFTTSSSSPPVSPANPNVSLLDYPHNPTFPRPDHLTKLIPIFFEHFGPFLPFLRQADIVQRASSHRLWNVHALGIAALASRFSTLPVHLNEPKYQHAHTYLGVAKPLIIQYKGGPSLQALQGLILLSWAECGNVQEAVRLARSLGLGFKAKAASFGVPPEEVIATWWSLMLIDELTTWNRDYDYQLDSTFLDGTFLQLSSLSLYRRKLGRCLYSHSSSPSARSSAIEGLMATYSAIMRSYPYLDLRRANLQQFVRSGTVPLYVAIHATYMSAMFRARLPILRDMSHFANNQRDNVIIYAQQLVELTRWCSQERRPQLIYGNLFLEHTLAEAGDVLSQSQRLNIYNMQEAEKNANETKECLFALLGMGSVWQRASARAAGLRAQIEPVDVSPTSLTPSLMAMNMGSMTDPSGHSPHNPISPIATTHSMYATGWNHPAGAAQYYQPRLHASALPDQAFYESQGYPAPSGHQTRASYHPNQHQHHYSQDPSWPYPR